MLHHTAVRTVGYTTTTHFHAHVVSVERPVEGAAETTFDCPSCGDAIVVAVLPRDDVVRTRRLSLALVFAGLLVLLVLLVLGLLTWYSASREPADSDAASVFAVWVTGLMAVAYFVFWNFRRGAGYEGVSGPRDGSGDTVPHRGGLMNAHGPRHGFARSSVARRYVDVAPDVVVDLDPRRR